MCYLDRWLAQVHAGSMLDMLRTGTRRSAGAHGEDLRVDDSGLLRLFRKEVHVEFKCKSDRSRDHHHRKR